MVEKLIIIGSGPAGYTAAIYAVRDDLNPLLIRGFEVGGQLMLTSAVENFPGFKSIFGPELMDKMAEQVKALNCRIIDDNVSKVDLNVYPYKVFVGEKEYETYSIIISTGASARWLGLENEKRLIGKGVSGCAVCDGAFF
ncbi:MAG: FAD-dependent oxidoreductase, partial [Candidatus Parvarchaeum sp.]|nr:FAD-dependent oxidoreductase [Candidatus Parvarchaeum tengchongense]